MTLQIICSAILMPDGYVIRGHRHNDCLRTASGILRYKEKGEERILQGFVTSNNVFVNRASAMIIAKNAGQVDEKHKGKELFSEDLY